MVEITNYFPFWVITTEWDIFVYSIWPAGEFDVKPDKKSPPVKKCAKKLGMIAGGTGECVMLSVKQTVKGKTKIKVIKSAQ